MKKIILSLAILSSIAIAFFAFKKQEVELKQEVTVSINIEDLNNIDTSVSVLNWKGSKPTGSHDGTVALKSGRFIS